MKTQTPTAPPSTLVLLDGDHSGRDEMNLAGNPFALLQAASRSGVTRIENHWQRPLPSGKLVDASWIVEGDSVLGLPGPSEELLYLVLLQLTREAKGEGNEWPREVFFSRYDLLRRLRWNSGTRGYTELGNAFARLQMVRVMAKNSFYDARSGAPFAQINFNILDECKIVEEGRGPKAGGHIPLSSFKWSDVMHQSFNAGNMRSLALDFALSLELPTSVRLFRLLELFRHAGPHSSKKFEIGVFKLRDRLAMTGCRYASKVREKLAGPIGELQARGYLAGVEYRKGAQNQEIAVFTFGDPRVLLSPREQEDLASPPHPSSLPRKAPESAQERAQRGFALWESLDENQRAKWRAKARENVVSDWWDRLENPESPISLKLWDLLLNAENLD